MTRNKEKRSRNEIARELNEERDGAYRIRIVESKKRKEKKLRPQDVLHLTEEDFDDFE